MTLDMNTLVETYVYITVVIVLLCHASWAQDCVLAGSPASYQLRCPAAGDQIVFVDIKAGREVCRNPDCHGSPASLLVDTHNCYWKQSCTIDFPEDPIIKVPKEEDQTKCFGKFPKFMSLEMYRCFTPTPSVTGPGFNLLDICRNSNDKGDSAYTHGLIRSHDYFPWMYEPRELRDKACAINILNGGHGEKLIISVLNMEIGEDDVLEVEEAGGKTTQVTSQTKTPLVTSAGKVTVRLKISEYSNGGKGFLLCFKFIGQHFPAENACDLITSRGFIFPPVMVSDPPTVTLEPAATTLKPGCYNKKGKLKKSCRKKGGKNKGKKPKKDKKKDRKKNRKNDRKGNKKRRHVDN